MTNFPLEKDKLSSANITNKGKIKEQDFDKNFSEDSDAVKKTQELLGSYKDMELKEDYTNWDREQAVRHLVKVIPAALADKKSFSEMLSSLEVKKLGEIIVIFGAPISLAA